MKLLSQRDCQHWETALILHRLGRHREAAQALERITPRRHTHPDVLELHLEILIKAGRWKTCADVAATLVTLHPKNPLGWVHRTVALRELNRTQEAFDLLLPAVEKWPGLWVIPYLLAECSAHLNQPAAARHWLKQALALDAEMVGLEVLDDVPLQPLYKALRKKPRPRDFVRP